MKCNKHKGGEEKNKTVDPNKMKELRMERRREVVVVVTVVVGEQYSALLPTHTHQKTRDKRNNRSSQSTGTTNNTDGYCENKTEQQKLMKRGRKRNELNYSGVIYDVSACIIIFKKRGGLCRIAAPLCHTPFFSPSPLNVFHTFQRGKREGMRSSESQQPRARGKKNAKHLRVSTCFKKDGRGSETEGGKMTLPRG